MEIWNRHFECMDRDELRRVQSEPLIETVERVYFNVPYYRHKMQEAGRDPETHEVLPEGSVGELVFTTLTKEGLPLIRYRTRDLTRLNYGRCKCGRTMVRMDKCLGRSDDMLIIRGVNLFPSQVESVLLERSEIKPHYQLIVDRVNNLDTRKF